jgi:hypothetical protein
VNLPRKKGVHVAPIIYGFKAAVDLWSGPSYTGYSSFIGEVETFVGLMKTQSTSRNVKAVLFAPSAVSQSLAL